MTKTRIIETNQGIQGELNVTVYDQMMKRLRDKGWMETSQIIKSGIDKGLALEVGPGPGYLGLEWLKKTSNTQLMALDVSPDMIQLAEKNAQEYGLSQRVSYVLGNALSMPFEDETYDAVFSSGSLHEWEEPQKVFNEINRVLKPGGLYFIGDLRRDMNPLLKWFLIWSTKPKEIIPGLITSIQASYTLKEIIDILQESQLQPTSVKKDPIGISVIGRKGK